MTDDTIQILHDRLLTGWQPRAGEIDRDIRQIDALNWMWNFADSRVIVPLGITYQTVDREQRKTKPVLHIDDHMTYALTADAFYWLYDAEESDKIRFLGG